MRNQTAGVSWQQWDVGSLVFFVKWHSMMCFLKVESRTIPLQWNILKLWMLVTKIISSSCILEGRFFISRWFEKSLYEGIVSAVLTELSKHPILYREAALKTKWCRRCMVCHLFAKRIYLETIQPFSQSLFTSNFLRKQRWNKKSWKQISRYTQNMYV